MMTQRIGTLCYMAPEIMKDEKYTNKVDIYGFGITLWEVVCAKVPFDDIKDDRQKIISAVTSGQRPAFPPEVLANVKVVKDVVEKCWADDPNSRPTAKELVSQMQTLTTLI